MPQVHRTDSLIAAVPPGGARPTFQKRYQVLREHYGLQGQAINPTRSHENGDVERSHHRFQRALNQALLLRGHRDFASCGDYAAFVRELFAQRNQGRVQRFQEERALLRPLPAQRLNACQRVSVRVVSPALWKRAKSARWPEPVRGDRIAGLAHFVNWTAMEGC